MNSDEFPTQKPQSQPAADGEPTLPVNETDDQLPSQIRKLSIAQNDLTSQIPPEIDPWGEENPPITPVLEETAHIAKIEPETEDRESESAIEQIEPKTDSQPTTTAERVTPVPEKVTDNLAARVQALQQQEQDLTVRIAALEADKAKALEALGEAQASIGRLVQDGLIQLDSRKQALQIEVEKLERRRDRIQKEMRTTFAGVSQDLAIRVQGFKDYLVGSLQDLAATAEILDLTPPVPETAKQISIEESQSSSPVNPRFAEQGFQERHCVSPAC